MVRELRALFLFCSILVIGATDPSCPSDDTSASVCGNGILEAGETCDVVGAPCCVNCQFVEPSYAVQATADDALICRLRTSTVNLGSGLKKNPKNLFRYDQQGSPKEPLPIYAQAKLDGSGIKIAWTDNSVEGIFDANRIHLTDLSQNADGSFTVNNDKVVSGREVRGMYSHYAGWTAVLVRTSVDELYPGTPAEGARGAYVQNMEIRKYQDSDGSLDWSTALEDDQDTDRKIGRIHDFGLADGRLAFGDGQLGAYYKVSNGNLDDWHEGDTFKTADASTGAPSTVSGWGCSHSMDLRLAYNPATKSFGRGCITDAFPSKGLHLHGVTLVKAIDANGVTCPSVAVGSVVLMDVVRGCQGGYTDSGLGQIITDGPAGFIMVFTAPQQDDSVLGGSDLNTYTSQLATKGGPGSDVGVVRVGKDGDVGPITWLTSTVGTDEIGAHITPYGPDQYLVAWREGDWSAGRSNGVCGASGVKYFMATIRQSDLSIVKAAEEVTKIAPSMERDDFFTFPNGDAGFAAPGGANKDAVVKYETEMSELQVTTVKLPPTGTCGNGRVEYWAGETCDDDSNCCIQCHLKAGAQCSEGACCDTQQCLFKPITVACALDADAAFALETCGADVDNCGSCWNGICSKIPGQSHGNTGWCPARTDDGVCQTRVAYTFSGASSPSCINNFYSEKTVPEGTVCGITADGLQQLCEIPDPVNDPDTAQCGAAGNPIPTFSSQPPCPHCALAAGAPCALGISWPELDAMEASGVKVFTGGLGQLMTDFYKVWVCVEDDCAPGDLGCFRFHEGGEVFDWWGFNSELGIVPEDEFRPQAPTQ